VDKAGIFVVGCCVFGGMGTYDYELELLDDQSQAGNGPEKGHNRYNLWPRFINYFADLFKYSFKKTLLNVLCVLNIYDKNNTCKNVIFRLKN